MQCYRTKNVLVNMREEITLIYCCEMKLEWGKKEYIVCCTRNKRKRSHGLRLVFGN
jgi:hypothetical protein